MRVKSACCFCGGSGCKTCDGLGYTWRFERDPEVSCQGCGESFRDCSEEAEFIGWHGVCPKCMISDEKVGFVMIDDSWIERINDECEELVSEGLGHYLVSNEAGSIRALIIRLRQAEKDAARYRWLRDSSCYNEFHTVGSADPSAWDEIIDEYIDEAVNGSNN